jgi:hypothetical protein
VRHEESVASETLRRLCVKRNHSYLLVWSISHFHLHIDLLAPTRYELHKRQRSHEAGGVNRSEVQDILLHETALAQTSKVGKAHDQPKARLDLGEQSICIKRRRDTTSRRKKDFRTFVASAEVDLPVEELQVIRTSVLQRMSSFSQAFEREYGRKAKKIKPKKKVPTLKVGICVFTWQSK